MADSGRPGEGLLFLGDVVLDRPYPVALSHPGIVCNLEGPLGPGPHPRRGTWNLCVDGCHFEGSFHPLPRAVSLANNHIMDYGPEALDLTRTLLGQLGIGHFGAGSASSSFGNPLVLTIGEMRVGLLAYAATDIGAQLGEGDSVGAAPLRWEVVSADLARLKAEGVDRIVVYPHWGVEHATLPRPEVVSLAHGLIDSGVDLVVGTHAHCMQAFETYAGKPVYYGLGNFIFPPRALPGHYDSLGRPTRHGHTVLLARQQRSLGVEYFPGSGEVHRRFFRFDGRRVTEVQGHAEDISGLTGDLRAYASLFDRRKAKDILSYRFRSLARNPRPSRILRFLGVALQGR